MNAPTTPIKPQPISVNNAAPVVPVAAKPVVAVVAPVKAAALTPSSSKPITPLKKPPFMIERTSASEGQWFKLMVYAMPGIGKTTLLGSSADVPDMRDILYVDCEKGRLAIEDNDRIKNPGFVLDNRVSCMDFKTAAHVHDFLKGHCKFRDENNIPKLKEYEAMLRGCSPADIDEPKRFRSVMVDSLSELDTYCNYQILGVTQDKVLEESGSNDVEVAGWAEFRKNNQMMQMLMRAFRDLPIHFLASAGRVYAEDEKKRRYYSPALTGQLRTQIPGFFDMVGYMTTEKVGDQLERRLYVKPVGTTNFEAKNRRSMFKADFFKDPTMTDIMKGIGLLK